MNLSSNLASIASMPSLNMTSIASMPILPSAQTGGMMRTDSKHRKLNHNFELNKPSNNNNGGNNGNATFQLQGQQQGGQGMSSMSSFQPKRMGQSLTTNNLSGFSGSQVGVGGSANATFDLSAMGGGGGGNSNPLLNQLAASSGTNPLLGMLNSTSTSRASTGPSANPFALRAQEMAQEMMSAQNSNNSAGGFSPRGGNGMNSRTNSNVNGRRTTNPTNPLYSPNSKAFPAREELQQEMTAEEDDELTAFLGKFAKALPPPKEDDEECTGEPDPLPRFQR